MLRLKSRVFTFTISIAYILLPMGLSAEGKRAGFPPGPQQTIASVHRVLIEVENDPDSALESNHQVYFQGPLLGSFENDSPPTMREGRKAKEFPFVSIRAVCDFSEQTKGDLALLPVVVDFEIQRQTKKLDSKNWEEGWRSVDLKPVIQFLDEAIGFEPDPVLHEFKDPVITIPLPSRVAGAWNSSAKHPAFAKYELTPDQHYLEYRLSEFLLEKARSFSPDQFENLNVKEPMLDKELLDSVEDAELKESLIEYLKVRPTLENTGLKLFRYFDLDITPEESYRYRIRLKLKNSAHGETPQKTMWSNVSNSVMIPKGYVVSSDADAVLRRLWTDRKKFFEKLKNGKSLERKMN